MTDIQFIRGDIRDKRKVEKAIDGVDVVFHLAAQTGADHSHQIPDKVSSINKRGTKTILDILERYSVDIPFIFVSSCNVYGNSETSKDLIEDDSPDPVNPYAESKLEAERLCRDSSIPTVILRPATNFGWSPGIRFNLVVNSFVFRGLFGEPLTIHGEGKNWRPFMHVEDTAKTILKAADWPQNTYNIGMGNFQLEEIATKIKDILGSGIEIEYQLDRDPGPSYRVDFSKAKSQGMETKYSLEQGIKDLVDNLERSESDWKNKNEVRSH